MPKKIPFGYNIINGQAVINEEQADQLKLYFKRYLEGDTMASAARAARLPLSTSTYPHLFSKKEYVGTDYYPAIIEESYQENLVSEWQKRKSESPRLGKTHPKKAVKVYKQFRIAGGAATGAFKNSSSTDGKGSTANAADAIAPVNAPVIDTAIDPVEYTAVIYQRIRPKYTSNTSNTNISTHPYKNKHISEQTAFDNHTDSKR